jgi:ribosome-associated protein
MPVLKINDHISIPARELRFNYFSSSGPGGQNVNKVATGVHLRFAFLHSDSLSESCKARLGNLADSRIGKDGVITIKAQRHRTREMNRTDAVNRLANLIRAAAAPRKKRRPTRPTAASRNQRLESKRKRGHIKQKRQRPAADEN